MRHLINLTLILTSLLGGSWTIPTPKEAPNTVLDVLKELAKTPTFQGASLGMYAYNVKRKKEICSINSDISLTPASTHKVMTTIAALEILGEDFRFKTQLQYDGNIDNSGTLHGNVYILGGGDPVFGSRFNRFKHYYYQPNFVGTWVQVLQDKGIQKIEGSVIGDACIYDENLVPNTWMQEDLGSRDGANCSGLSIFDNYFKVFVEEDPDKPGQTRITDVQPAIPDKILLTNHVQVGESECGLKITGGAYDNTRVILGCIAQNSKQPTSIQGTLSDPAYWAAYTLHTALKEKGIKITHDPESLKTIKKTDQPEPSRQNIHTIYSPPLREIVRATNEKSMNLYADHLLVHIGLIKQGKGTIKSGCRALENFWQQHIPIIGMHVEDGSGIANTNFITPKQLVKALCYAIQQDIGESFFQSLPIAGKTGNLAGLFQDKALQGKLHLKSGYHSHKRTFCGYYKNRNGEQIVFSILINHFQGNFLKGQEAMEKIIAALVSSS